MNENMGEEIKAKIYSEISPSQLHNAFADLLVQVNGSDLNKFIRNLEHLLVNAKEKQKLEEVILEFRK